MLSCKSTWSSPGFPRISKQPQHFLYWWLLGARAFSQKIIVMELSLLNTDVAPGPHEWVPCVGYEFSTYEAFESAIESALGNMRRAALSQALHAETATAAASDGNKGGKKCAPRSRRRVTYRLPTRFTRRRRRGKKVQRGQKIEAEEVENY